ncbi:flagellar hook-length control protein FliK [Fervidobacterium sp.]
MIDIVNLSKLLGNADKVQSAIAEINKRVDRGESFEKVLQSVINELSKNREEVNNTDAITSNKALQNSNVAQSKVNAQKVFSDQVKEKTKDNARVIQEFNTTPSNLKDGENVLKVVDDSKNIDKFKDIRLEDEILERVADDSKQTGQLQTNDSKEKLIENNFKVVEKEIELTNSKALEMPKAEESVTDAIHSQSNQLERQKRQDEEADGTKEQTEIRKEFMEKFKPESLSEQKDGKIYASAERYFQRDYTSSEYLNKNDTNISRREQLGDYLKEETQTNQKNTKAAVDNQSTNNQTKNTQLRTTNQETRSTTQGDTIKQVNTQLSSNQTQNVQLKTTSQETRSTTQGDTPKQINTQLSSNQTQNVQLKITNQETRSKTQGDTPKQVNTQVSNIQTQNVLPETTISQNARSTTQVQITKQINTQVSSNQTQNAQLKAPVYQDMRLTTHHTTNVTPNKNNEVLERDNLLQNSVQKHNLTENAQTSKPYFAVGNNHTGTKKNDTSGLIKPELNKTEDFQLIERADKSNNNKTEKFDKVTSYHVNIQTNQKEQNISNEYTTSSQNVVKNAEKSQKNIYQKESEHNDIISKELLNNNNAYVINRSADVLEKLSGTNVAKYEIVETSAPRKVIYKQEDMDKSKTVVFIDDKEFLEIVQKLNLMISLNTNIVTSNSNTTRSLKPVHAITNDVINQSVVNELKEPDSIKMLLTSLKDVANEQSGLTIRNWKKDESAELKETSAQDILTKDKESVDKTELTVKNQDNPNNLTSQTMSSVEVHNRFVSQVVEDVKHFDTQSIESSSREQVQSQNVPSATDTQRTNDNSTHTKNHMEEFRNSAEQPSKNKIEIKSFEVEYKTKEEAKETKMEHSIERPNVSNKFIERLAEMTYKPSEAKLEQTYQSGNRFELAERLQHAQNLEEIYQKIREFGFSNRLEENVRMKLYPENLGNLDVELKKEGRFISVVFVAENEKSRELLEKNASYLRDRLSNLDFEVRAVEVRMKEENNNYEDGRQQRHGQEPNEQNNQEHRRKAFKEEVMKDDDERKRNI